MAACRSSASGGRTAGLEDVPLELAELEAAIVRASAARAELAPATDLRHVLEAVRIRLA